MIKVNVSYVKYFLGFTASLLVAGLVVWGTNYYKGRNVNLRCTAYFHQTGAGGAYEMKANFIFNLTKPDAGIITIDGNLNYQGKSYVIRRDTDITYHYVSKNLYQIDTATVFRNARDTTPAELIDRHFFSTKQESSRYFTIKRVQDLWLIGSLTSPAFLCRNTSASENASF